MRPWSLPGTNRLRFALHGGQRWSRLEKLVGATPRLQQVAADLVDHFEARTAIMDGKAMIVGMSRDICAQLYNEIVALRPDWHDPDPSRA